MSIPMTSFGIETARDMLNMCDAANEEFLRSGEIRHGLAAVLFGTHVWDWYWHKDCGKPDDKTAKYDGLSNEFEPKVTYAELLRRLANGTKHPIPGKAIKTENRGAEWEDADFWDQAGDDATWFVDALTVLPDGRTVKAPRSLHAILKSFIESCDQFLKGRGL